MARRRGYRKGRRTRRRHYRRRTVAVRALRRVRTLSRKMAGEVRKLDVNAIIPEEQFTGLTPALGSAADNATSLPDFGYVYSVFGYGRQSSPGIQGLQIDDFTGNQIRAKYLYLGIHLQMPVRPAGTSASSIQQPLCMRCMVVQDRNFSSTLTVADMVFNLFGLSANTGGSSIDYYTRADYTILPINPQEPGRFKVIRDFKMYVAPGYRMDYYKKLILLQRDMFSSGRFYAGTGLTSNETAAPGNQSSSWSNMRNKLYVCLFYQSPTLYGVATTGTPDFTVSVQTRLAYYDN